jgi:transcriptional regulator with XRE-family HTH domain
MPKIIVTRELASLIRSLRLERNITSKALSECINKSPSYITKFEKGEIQSISKDALDSLLNCFVENENSVQDIRDEILKKASITFSAKEMEAQLWYTNYDTVYCAVPIPESLINSINELLNENGISREYLWDRINSNEFIQTPNSDPAIDNKKLPKNEWFFRDKKNRNSQEIIIDLELEKLNNILDGIRKKTRYVFMLAIVLYSLKIQAFHEKVILSDEENSELYNKAVKYLSEHNFYSRAEKYKRIAATEQLSIPDQINQDEINKLMSFINLRSDLDVQHTNEVLISINKNVDWDIAFMEKLSSLPFYELQKASHTFNQKLLDQIKTLIEKAKEAPEKEKEKEQYD